MSKEVRILIIRLSALGDVAMASGLIPALRARYPGARLCWLTEPAAAPLLQHNPRLDEVIIWPRPQWRALWKERRFGLLWQEIRKFRSELRKRRFDLVVDAQGLLKSGLCAWLTGAPRRVGLHPREGSQWLVNERVEPPAEGGTKISSEYRLLAEQLGAPAQSFRLEVAVGSAPRAKVQATLAQAGVPAGYVALCPFTTRPQKHWFEERWADLARQLAAKNLHCVLLGGPGDKEAAERIRSAGAPVVNLAGQLTLDESVAVIEGARLLIGVDTGLTHIGSALRVPTLALFGSTCPYVDADVPSTRVLYEAVPCSPCHRRPSCNGRFDCMRLHTVETVSRQALMLLEAAA